MGGEPGAWAGGDGRDLRPRAGHESKLHDDLV